MKTEHDTRGTNTLSLPSSSTQTQQAQNIVRGTNSTIQPSSSTQTQHTQNISRGTNTTFQPSSSTQTQQAQNISRETNTDVSNDTQQEQCHSCQVEEQPDIQYASEFARQLGQSHGNRPGLEYIQQPVTQNMQNDNNLTSTNYSKYATPFTDL